ncbi:hypothetical protein KC571_01785 [candidate division WWE3 bacterium]|uniref:Uncharacterized protein n=1 Tax=candidate division WWE3 bacterium TaxID=2053526 RepID=A0A955LH35_UNCKA|nr:hypothetical protein [candidate division WWE3 bacterium]
MPKKESTASGSNILGALIGIGIIISIIVAGLYILKITGDDGGVAVNENAEPTPTPAPRYVSLVLDNLPTLANGHYAAWVVGLNSTYQVGEFNVNESGKLTTLDGNEIAENEFILGDFSETPDEVIVTIEVGDTNVSEPSATVLMRGKLQNGIGAMEFSAVDLSAAEGTFVLATPTNGADTDETSGIWFISLNDDKTEESAGLTVPTAPEGWQYAGWVDYNGVILETGKFVSPNAADFLGLYNGDQDAPPFPGEDFINNAPNTIESGFPIALPSDNTRVYVTLEPISEEFAEETLGLEVFSANVAADAQPQTNYSFERVYQDNFPSGLVVIR